MIVEALRPGARCVAGSGSEPSPLSEPWRSHLSVPACFRDPARGAVRHLRLAAIMNVLTRHWTDRPGPAVAQDDRVKAETDTAREPESKLRTLAVSG
jgi:hypothetical protein